MNQVQVDGRLAEAIRAWYLGETPLIMGEIAPLPVTMPDGRTLVFGGLSPEQLEAVALALRDRADRDRAAVEREWDEGEAAP
jgi:hypothetical protein